MRVGGKVTVPDMCLLGERVPIFSACLALALALALSLSLSLSLSLALAVAPRSSPHIVRSLSNAHLRARASTLSPGLLQEIAAVEQLDRVAKVGRSSSISKVIPS